MYNPRLELERAKQAEWREKSRKGGVASGQARGKGGSTVVQPPHEPNGNTLSPSLSPKDTTGKKIASGAEAPKPAGWVAVLYDIWQSEVGEIQPGRIGKQAKALHDRHGDALASALRAYIASTKAAGRDPRWAWFVDAATTWVERASAGLAVIDGEMSPELERRSRPSSVRRVG